MRRNRSGVGPCPETVFGNGPVLDSRTTRTNSPHGHSSASSLDPIATSDDEEEFVISQLFPSSPGSPQGHPSFKPEAQSSPFLKVRSRTPKPEIIYADGVDNRKPNPSCYVVGHSPPERSTRIQSRTRPDTARVSSLKYFGESEDNMNGEVSEPLNTHKSPVIFPRPTRPKGTAPDSIPDGSRCDMELSEDLTAQDIDILLGAVPVPFDFSLSRYHLSSRENGQNDGQSEENSLWWFHPIFESRAKADIRRTLRALLPEDPAQDPPSPVGGAGAWTSELRPRKSGARIWVERLEDAFGPGPLNRGLGRKPCRVVDDELADIVRTRPVPCALCARRGRRCIGKDGRACLSCKERRVACSHVAKPRKDIPVGAPESDLQVPNTPNLQSIDKRLRPPQTPIDVRPGDSTSGSAGPTLHAGTRALRSFSAPGGKRVRVDRIARFLDAPGEVDHADGRGRVAREVLNTSAPTPTCRITKKRRPDDAELMSKEDLPDWKRCAWCARRKVKCAPRVGSQPPYQCFHCEDHKRKCTPNKNKDSRRSDASERRHARHAGPSHLRDVVISPPVEDYPWGAIRRAMIRQNELLAQLRDQKAQLEAQLEAERAHNLKG